MTATTMRYHAIRVEYVNPFVSAMLTTFKTMLSLPLERGDLYIKEGVNPLHEVSGIIGLSGRARGVVLLGMSRQVALHVTELFSGDPAYEIDARVIDSVGELANIVAGSAKGKLENLDMSVSLPSVISGRNHVISFPTGAMPIGIPFQSQCGPLTLEVSLVDAQ